MQNQKDARTRENRPAFDEKSLVNFGPLILLGIHVSLDPLKCTYLGLYFSP